MTVDPKYYSAVSQRPGPREHIRCEADDVGGYVLLPGDPGRVPAIASRLDDAREVAWSREFRTFVGTLHGTKVTVTSTGIGGASAAIAIEELAQLGAHTVIRIGTCGALQPSARVGDLVVASGAVRDEGTSHQYAPVNYPAVATPEVTAALRDAALARDVAAHVGIVHTTDTFYGQHEPERMPIGDALVARHAQLVRLGVLCMEMETAAVFVVAAALGLRAGSVLAVAGNRTLGEHLDDPDVSRRRDSAVAAAIDTAIDAVAALAGR